ncbi:hypothetical protein HYW75_00260 [Candidatus Pacearchaeota archaeon]|nr:hypothetical protein [Candidatus Pacearchaeota archaeon]
MARNLIFIAQIKKTDRFNLDAKEVNADIEEYMKRKNDFLKGLKLIGGGRELLPTELFYSLATRLGESLKKASNEGFLLAEVAPRDIVVDLYQNPRFADWEIVEYYEKPLSRVQRNKQFNLLEGEFSVRGFKTSAKKQGYSINRFLDLVRDSYLI